ncbi:MAG: hypothetical protein ACREBW_09985 [Candidatus Micrarchaeaceae archaeon]
MEEAVRWRVFHGAVQDIKTRNADADPTKSSGSSTRLSVRSVLDTQSWQIRGMLYPDRRRAARITFGIAC